MNILIITNKLPYPPKDGGAIATFSLAFNLAKNKNNVDILAINTSKHYFDISEIPVEITQYITFHDIFIDTKISPAALLKNFLFSNKPYNAQRFISDKFEQKIISVLRNKAFDLVQFEGLYVLPYIKIVRKYSRAKISYRAHNIEHEIWQRAYKQTTDIVKKIYLFDLSERIRRLEKKYVNSYDMLVPITKRDGQKLNEMGNLKPHLVVPTGINVAQHDIENIEPEIPSLFHIGALDWAPNQQGILWFIKNCWDKILNKQPDLKFYIAGRNAPDWFVKKIQKKNIIYLGEIDDAHKFMYSKALMIVPLLSGSGMRIKIVEGMACKKAIITTSIGAEGIDAEHDKEIIIANNSTDFIKHILKLSNDTEKIKSIGDNAFLFVLKNFDNFAIANKLKKFYLKQLTNN